MSELNARILFWGIEGAGKTTTLQKIHAKLRPDLRGELRHEPTRLDPTVTYEALSIRLGEVGGIGTEIELIAVPGAPDQAMTRKQLLDRVDGIVLVLDSSPERIDSNQAAIDELRSSLAAYGQRLDAFPIVLQYNKRDVADPFAIEDLHRRIGFDQAAVFETIATTGHGILSTLTTISKHVVRSRRAGSGDSPAAHTNAPTAATAATIDRDAGSSHEILEAAILSESEGPGEPEDDLAGIVELDPVADVQPDWNAVAGAPPKSETELGAELRIVSVGQASLDAGGRIRLPLVLGDESGQTRSLTLSLRIDAPDGDD
ncbi:MAG TPA: hypothetical protein ENI85_11635 [Deltaproteobacteria bacterium]|nr:hypothetical protein [Deltaproteobacteria bacterium]